MRYRLLLTVSLLLCPATSVAQLAPPVIAGCQTVSWEANTEADLDGYTLYSTKDGITMPTVPIDKALTDIPCTQAGVVEGGTYTIWMTASDEAGNESVPSEMITVDWRVPDVTAPATPQICLTVTVAGVPTQLCSVESP